MNKYQKQLSVKNLTKWAVIRKGPLTDSVSHELVHTTVTKAKATDYTKSRGRRWRTTYAVVTLKEPRLEVT